MSGWLYFRLNQTNDAAIAVLPLMQKRIACAQVAARREKEEGSAGAVRDAKLAQRLHHRLHAVMVGRHGEHAERLPAEMLLVLFPGMRGEIRAKHAWKYVSEFSYRRNMRHSHWAMFNLLVHAFALPRLATD
jgi:hypothetical protein